VRKQKRQPQGIEGEIADEWNCTFSNKLREPEVTPAGMSTGRNREAKSVTGVVVILGSKCHSSGSDLYQVHVDAVAYLIVQT
jgi:hypothetical protein